MSSGLLTAHNAVFDMGVLQMCLRDYDIEWKSFAMYLYSTDGKAFARDEPQTERPV